MRRQETASLPIRFLLLIFLFFVSVFMLRPVVWPLITWEGEVMISWSATRCFRLEAPPLYSSWWEVKGQSLGMMSAEAKQLIGVLYEAEPERSFQIFVWTTSVLKCGKIGIKLELLSECRNIVILQRSTSCSKDWWWHAQTHTGTNTHAQTHKHTHIRTRTNTYARMRTLTHAPQTSLKSKGSEFKVTKDQSNKTNSFYIYLYRDRLRNVLLLLWHL